mmetsp:Transcript_17580/g.45006  ORF Transcript_17580/g.45006 Transcript_17580/m.45006 type:complete len:270 (-) Transcript_17580:471-1280(-)
MPASLQNKRGGSPESMSGSLTSKWISHTWVRSSSLPGVLAIGRDVKRKSQMATSPCAPPVAHSGRAGCTSSAVHTVGSHSDGLVMVGLGLARASQHDSPPDVLAVTNVCLAPDHQRAVRKDAVPALSWKGATSAPAGVSGPAGSTKMRPSMPALSTWARSHMSIEATGPLCRAGSHSARPSSSSAVPPRTSTSLSGAPCSRGVKILRKLSPPAEELNITSTSPKALRRATCMSVILPECCQAACTDASASSTCAPPSPSSPTLMSVTHR